MHVALIVPDLELHDRQQPRVFQCSSPVSETSQIRLITSKGDEVLHTAVTHEHYLIPALVLRADKESRTSAQEEDVATARAQQRERVCNISSECCRAGNWSGRREPGECGIVGHGPESQQVQHYDRPRDPPLDEGSARGFGCLQITSRSGESGFLSHTPHPSNVQSDDSSNPVVHSQTADE
jgi:hypothetical protein